MKNKFLIGARFASVMLALLLMGAGSAWAQGGWTIGAQNPVTEVGEGANTVTFSISATGLTDLEAPTEGTGHWENTLVASAATTGSTDADELADLAKLVWTVTSAGTVSGGTDNKSVATTTITVSFTSDLTADLSLNDVVVTFDGIDIGPFEVVLTAPLAGPPPPPAAITGADVVTINLADIKLPNLANRQNSQTASTGTNAQAGLGTDVFAAWPAGTTGTWVSATAPATAPAKGVLATFEWKSAAITGLPNGHYDSTLTFKIGADVKKVIVIGDAVTSTATAGPKVIKIVFDKPTGTDEIPVEWDGGKIVGQAPNTRGSTTVSADPKPGLVEEFLTGYKAAIASDASTPYSSGKVKNISIISGSIEAWSKYILKNVGGSTTAKNAPDNMSVENVIGHWNPGLATRKSIELKHHGSVAALEIALGNPTTPVISINPPNDGTYTITADGAALAMKTGVSDLVIGKTADAGPGKIFIYGQEKGTIATAAPAILAGSITVNGWPVAGGAQGVVIRSKSSMVLQSTGNMKLTDVEVHHAASGTDLKKTVVFKSGVDVELNRVKVTNGGANGGLPGSLIGAGNEVKVSGGSFYPAFGGIAIMTTGDVTIEGATISSDRQTTQAGYVVNGAVVTLKSTDTKSAVVTWAGSGSAVGGINAKNYVVVQTEFSTTRAEVNVKGVGDGIFIQTDNNIHGAGGTKIDEVVKLKGDAASSVEINVEKGQAVRVANYILSVPVYVNIRDARITRTGTGKDVTGALVEVIGGDVFVFGTSLVRTALTAGDNLAISAQRKGLSGDKGGNVWINGGYITGSAAGAVYGYQVNVQNFGDVANSRSETAYLTTDDGPGTQYTVISSSGGVTVNSLNDIKINNGFASVLNTSTTVDDLTKKDGGRSAVVWSSLGAVTVFNVDSIKGVNATALLTVETGKAIKVYGGKVKSASGYAIISSGSVDVDWQKGSPVGTGVAPYDDPVGTYWMTAPATGDKLDQQRHYKIEVSTGSTSSGISAIYAPYATASLYEVTIGDAQVLSTATSGGAAAITVLKGNVKIAHREARIVSNSGTGVKVTDANVTLDAGDIKSEASGTGYAGIWVVNGEVKVGTNMGGETEGTEDADLGHYNTNRSSVSSNGSVAVILEGGGEKTVEVGYYGMLSVKGAGAAAGMIKVNKMNKVKITQNAKLISTGAQAFAIEAEEGDVTINGGRIESISSKQAISTKGGKILINGSHNGSLDRHADGGKLGVRITGKEGILVRAIKNTVTGRAGEVIMTGGFIYNEQGTGIRADDTVRVYGGEIVVDKDTAITAGTAGAVGLVDINAKYTDGQPHVWAAAQYAKANPVAVTARMVRINGGVVEANTIRSAADNTSTYPDSKATGILLKKGPGTPIFKIGSWRRPDPLYKVWEDEAQPTTIIAHGANTAINCEDGTVTLDIVSYNGVKREGTPATNGTRGEIFRISVKGDELGAETLFVAGTVTIKAGDNGIGVKSIGEVRVFSTDVISEESKDDEGLKVGVWIGTGNGPQARAITMPVPTGENKKKDLTLENTFIEAGSDGAVAVDADAKAIVRVDHSVIVVRHLSTGINGRGGVYINGGYVEVLATNNNYVGTAVTGREIRISGGQGEDDEIDKSEIHSKGIAVKDNVEGAVVQVTGRIHMSGTVASNMMIGASVVTDTGIVTMGSVKSRNLWKLTTVSDRTIENEKGKSLTIPLGVTVEVGDNGSRLKTEKFDTVKVAGVVTTIGKQAGAEFINEGRVLVEKGGNVKFNKGSAKSFKNSEGIIVLKTGSMLDDSLLVHDTGSTNERKAYTFLKWAKILSGDTAWAIGSRGPGRVVVPPMYATLYGNQKLYVDEEDIAEDESDYWTAESKRVDSVYTAKFVKYPLDRRYKPYFETEDFPAEGDFTLGSRESQGTVKVDEDGTVMLTSAGTFQRTAIMNNEAGEGTKVYTHIVEKVDLNRIITNQTEGPIFFDGYFYNKNRRVVGHDGEDTVLVREGSVEVKYTGNTAQLLDGITGAAIEGYTDLSTDKSIHFTGWGTPTYWYKGAVGGETFYPLTSSVPMNVGAYEVYASFAEGNNFVAVPSEPKSIVLIGTVNVVEGDLMSVFNQKDNESYQLVVDLEAKVAKSGVKVSLPSVLRFGARYDSDNIEIGGPAADVALVGLATIPDSVLTFSVNSNTAVGQFIEFKVPISSTADPKNLTDGLYITVRARFLSKEDMKEIKPTYITVDYRNVKLNGLLVGTTYTINGETLIATSSDTTIKEDWIGKTIQVVAQPGVGSYKTASDVANIVIGPRQLVTDSLKAVKGENAKTNISVDGRLTGTSKSMEYKLASDTIWTPATAVVTNGLKAGAYNVRLAPTASAFPSESVSVAVGFDTEVKVLESDREIPNKSVVKEVAVAPVAKVTASFTAGPSPVSKNAGSVKFFSSKQVKSGTLYVFDATGKSVAKIKAKSNGREIGAWNLRDKKGAVVAEGSYVVKGKIVGKDGTKENVSTLFSVVK